ncbi:mitogen-activated protein kinase kinase 2 [Leishmania infantum JPCM5]|uniref:non-specific serine/threonine protein kinase n=3 Tax=Leishmania donovani species complex TaxID=38574 RepID=A4HVG7_LEIIN|nr:mitogen-activated protein kinase kinase 2 [Leishmania infantum JPCM5]XP_003859240.1 mitogen-activated protein kinase kinase 2 [Leishmania donovani]CAC9465208.1 mitogen-activated_protein_kinase_kinase_2 [Leishmania infantum]AYU77111.1 mitogen-activated protein kinase kinase 2 [Leishmania donovani]TPP45134.1 Protein kinase domain family protein [Leishmania donovani]CAM66433.1 mitogen-activated protein kinase kinase 2 [Leishmania infantum JPCM5]CBZ32528.1 mitogen-activated protein kinase kina|eukprot:XP_001464058.1 mitogen-activated protein kinase kinase 2 [Leishmania infantum JPCM5]
MLVTMENYQIIESIGEGSFGKVYKARIKGTGQIVAMKFIVKKGKNEKELKNLRSEIEILTKLNHPHIIMLFDSFETDSDFVVVMEYAQGELYDILEDEKQLPAKEVQKIAKQLIQALNYLHSNRIIHRDMKPQNILIGQNGAVKLADFGFARSMSYNTIVLTSIKGTPLYMAPELVQERAYDNRVDLWSLGCILYELYYGKPPFYTNNLFALIKKIVCEPVKYDSKANDPISPEFKSFLSGLLTKSASSRLNWPELLNHPFVQLTKSDASWQDAIMQHDSRMKARMDRLGCLRLHGNAGRAAPKRKSTQSDDIFNLKTVQKLTSGCEFDVCATLTQLVRMARASNGDVTKSTALLGVFDSGVLEAALTLLNEKQSVKVVGLVLQFVQELVFPEHGDLLAFPSQRPKRDGLAVLEEKHSRQQEDLFIRQQVALKLMKKPHTALDFIISEISSGGDSLAETCVKIMFQCFRWENSFGPMVTQLRTFPEMWAAILKSVNHHSVSRGETSHEYAALVFHTVSIVIPHVKLASPQRINREEVLELVTQGLSAVCYYEAGMVDAHRNKTPPLVYAAAAALLIAFAHRELKDIVSFKVNGALLDGIYSIVDAVTDAPSRPVTPRALGSSYGYPDYGLLDGVAHMLSLVFSDSDSLVYAKLPGRSEHRFLESDTKSLALLVMTLLRDSDPRMELSPNGVQTLLRAAQQIFQQEKEQALSMSLLMEPIAPYSGESGSLCWLSVICRTMKTDYFRQLFYWPACRGGGATGVSAHVTIVSQILSDSLRPVSSSSNPTPVEDKLLGDVSRVLYKEKVIELLVHAMDYSEGVFLGSPFAIIAKLCANSADSIKAFVDCGGVDAARIRRILDPDKAGTGLMSDGLVVLSQMARMSAEFYEPIHRSNLYDCLAALLQHSEKDLRGKTCTLIGNLCKHSDFFFEPLEKNHIVERLVKCCSDSDAQTQKLAAFAIGNAAFHSGYLYNLLSPAIPSLVGLLACGDAKTRQNAAGALSNFVRNGDQLVSSLAESSVVESLLKMLRDDDTPSSKKVAVLTINSFCAYDVFRRKFIALNLREDIRKLQQDPNARADPSIQKYVGNLVDRLG